MPRLGIWLLSVMAMAATLMTPIAMAADSRITDDRAAIDALQARYMFALDWCNAEAYRGTFAKDGVLTSSNVEEHGDEIAAFIRSSCPNSQAGSLQGSAHLRHFFTNVVLDIKGNQASGRTYWFVMGTDADHRAQLRAYGHFEDELAREDGTWKFARRKVYNEMTDNSAATSKRPTVSFSSPPVVGNGYAANRAAIEDLQARYLYAMNWFDPAAYAGTFTPDGVVHMGERVERGRKAIETVITDYKVIIMGHPTGAERGLRPPAVRHAITNVVVQIQGNRAHAWAYWNTFQNDNLARSAQIGNYGSYEDDLEKIDGRWYFRSRKVFNQMKADRVASDTLPMLVDIDAGPPAHDTVADDRAAIKNLQARYMFALDWQDPAAYAATFTQDGVLVSAVAEARGRKAIQQEVAKMRDNDRATVAKEGLRPFSRRHVITNLALKINGDHATGRAYWAGYNDDNPERRPYVESYGHYEDELVKVDGHWLFSKRTIFNEQRADHAASGKWPLLE
jgi:SnoaL-like domain